MKSGKKPKLYSVQRWTRWRFHGTNKTHKKRPPLTSTIISIVRMPVQRLWLFFKMLLHIALFVSTPLSLRNACIILDILIIRGGGIGVGVGGLGRTPLELEIYLIKFFENSQNIFFYWWPPPPPPPK